MKYIIRTLLLACCCMQAQAQAPWKPDTELEKQLQQSNHVHRIMKANPAHAGLTRWGKKEVLKSRGLPWPKDFGALRHRTGTIHVDRKVTVSGKGSVRLDTPASLGKKNPTNRNYATPEIIRPLDREDLRGIQPLFRLGICGCTGRLSDLCRILSPYTMKGRKSCRLPDALKDNTSRLSIPTNGSTSYGKYRTYTVIVSQAFR